MTIQERRATFWSWALYDWANSAFSAIVTTFVFATYFTKVIAETPETGTSQWGLAMGFAGLLLAIGSPIIGAMADRGGHRKQWLAFCTLLCVVPTALLWFVQPGDGVLLGLSLLVLSTLGAEFAFVFYNAMLPDIAPPERIGRWSGWGWGLGYAGGLVCLVAALFLFIEGTWLPLDHDRFEHIRATFVLCALWYFVFGLPILFFTPSDKSSDESILEITRGAFQQLIETGRRVGEYQHIVRFLVARIFYVDGLITLFAFGGIYAAGTFGMTSVEVLYFGIGLQVTAGLGAAGFALLDDRIGARRVILLSLIGLGICGGIAIFVTNVTVFWIVGMTLGIFVGPAQASSRSYLARLAPAHLRNEAFGFFVFSGKSTSFAGPLLVSLLTYWSGSQRVGISVIAVFFLVGFLLMRGLPDDRDLTVQHVDQA